MRQELEKTYRPFDVESRIYKAWEASGFFNPDNLPGTRKKVFSIAMPPPNVTGELHLGHATGMTIEDALIRFHRMQGEKTLYLPGTDHAGISTQVMVERLIAKSGLSKHKLGREKFLRQVWQWKKKYGSRITDQIRQLGASCDWSREHFTMDETLTTAVQKAFITMYKDGLIYRGDRIVNWCTRCASALSDLEVKHQETSGKLWYIRYPLFGSTKYLVVATTRPETMLGDTAVAVNPQDKRYQGFIGKTALLPIMNREIPIIADENVDIEFGTGAVKVTPAHDPLDYEIGERHNLESINVIGQDGRMTKAAGEYFGKSPQDTRHEILRRLEDDELLEKIVDYIHNIARCDRCNGPIDPLISKQWFVKTKPLAKPAIEAIKKGKIKIIPQRFEKVYFHWMNNIKDWCISRQLWWGHQIPVWYCGSPHDIPKQKMGFHKRVVPQLKKGKTKTYRLRNHRLQVGDKVLFENSQTEKLFGIGTVINVEKSTIDAIDLQDPSNGTTYKKIEELIAAFKFHYPKKEITTKTPVYIYSYKFTPQEQLKGCGEVIASVDKPKKCTRCGKSNFLKQDSDTLDTWFSSGLWTFSTLGWPKKTKDLKTFHPTSVMETGWDILFFWVARMIMMSLYFTKEVPFKTVYLHGLVLDRHGKKMSKSKGTGVDPLLMTQKYGTDAIRLSLVLGTAPGQDFRLFEEKIAGYRNFINKLWNVSRYILSAHPKNESSINVHSLADQWILSRTQTLISKVTKNFKAHQLSDAGTAIYDFVWHEFADWYVEIAKTEQNSAVLQYVLEVVLELAHPLIPFVTEEIWSRWQGNLKKKQLQIEKWPLVNKKFSNPKAEKQFELIRKFIIAVRGFRAEQHVPAQEKLIAFFTGSNCDLITNNATWIQELALLKTLKQQSKTRPIASWPGLDLFIDYTRDESTKKREIERLSKFIQKLESKLSNKKFLERAPKDLIAHEKARLREQRETLKKLL